jgi:bile acid-coenzyme A ligase
MPLIPMGQLPAHHAARDPRRPAITLGEIALTRQGLEVRANRRARALRGHGVGLGDFVTVALPNGFELYETTFALWKLGAIPNMVSSKLPDDELGAIVQLADPRLVIGVEPSRLPGRSVVAAGVAVDQTLSAEPLETAISPHWKAMTSGGSTGRPKIIVDHMAGAVDPETPNMLQQLDDVLLNPGPLYHNAPFGLTHSGLFRGAHVIEMGRFDAGEALRLIERHKVQWVNFVPTMMARIWKLPAEERLAADVSSLRVVFHMASPCPVWLKAEWTDWIGPEKLFELYGGTEGQGITVITGEEWLEHRGSVGKVWEGAAMRVLDADGKDCPPGQIGEVYFRPDAGRNSTYHYIGAEAKATGEWESLGDLGHVDADGYLYLADRRTDLILSGGANIYPAEVEAALDSHPDVLTSAVVGLPDDDLGQRVHAIVQPREGAELSQEMLVGHLERRLVRYKIPRSFEFSATPLRDDAGKTRRSTLREQRTPAPSTEASR